MTSAASSATRIRYESVGSSVTRRPCARCERMVNARRLTLDGQNWFKTWIDGHLICEMFSFIFKISSSPIFVCFHCLLLTSLWLGDNSVTSFATWRRRYESVGSSVIRRPCVRCERVVNASRSTLDRQNWFKTWIDGHLICNIFLFLSNSSIAVWYEV